MVANAGIAQVKSCLDLTEEDVDRMFGINLGGVMNCYQVSAKQFIKQGTRGKLLGAARYGLVSITVSFLLQKTRHPLAFFSCNRSLRDSGSRFSSIMICLAFKQGKTLQEKAKGDPSHSIVAYKPFALLSHYSASKWAVRGLTQAFAMEVARYGITCNAYAPGIVGTAMWDEIDEKMGAVEGAAKGDTLKKYSGTILMGRVSVPEDVAKTVSFLASEGSEYMTGQTLIIDGGIQFS